jgi:hypothetical protein
MSCGLLEPTVRGASSPLLPPANSTPAPAMEVPKVIGVFAFPISTPAVDPT